MFESFAKSFQDSVKPLNELAAINAKALQGLSEQQTEWFNGFLSSQVAQGQALSEQEDLSAMMASQQAYATELQQSLIKTGQNVAELMQDAQEQALAAIKPAAVEAQAEPAPKKAAAKVAKASPKKAKPAAKPDVAAE